MNKDELIALSDLNREDNVKYISSEAQGIAITLDSDRYAPTLCKLERAYICGRRKSEEQIADLEAQIKKLIDFVLSKTECCDVCPITDTCNNSEGTCPYAGILSKGEEAVTREWIMQKISKEIKEND